MNCTTTGQRRHPFRLCRAVLVLLAGSFIELIAARGETPLSVADLIGLKRFGPQMIGGNPADTRDEPLASPDGLKYAVVTQRGNLGKNIREFELLIFARDNHWKWTPTVVATFASSSNRSGIAQLSWVSNRALAFLAENANQSAQVYTYDVEAKSLSRRTEVAGQIASFQVSRDGRTVVYAIRKTNDYSALYADQRARGFVVPARMGVAAAMTGQWEFAQDNVQSGPTTLEVCRDGKRHAVKLPTSYGRNELDGPFVDYNLRVSPSGRYALVRFRVVDANPPTWKEYVEPTIVKGLAAGGQYSWWIIIDLESGEARPLTGGPSLNFTTTPRWVDDDVHVWLENDLLPLGTTSGAERTDRASKTGTGIIDLRTGEFSHLGNLSGRNANSRELWIDEALNTPWRLLGTAGTGDTQIVYDPNSTFDLAKLARVSIISWEPAQGVEYQGTLYWPMGEKPGAGYPLVIQTHGVQLNKFRPEGYSLSGYAAQPLATSGIMVAQVGVRKKGTPEWSRLTEGERAVRMIEGLVQKLQAEGVDSTKVGLQGFSRSSYHVQFFLTHSNLPIAAASCTDGVDGSYMQYLVFGATDPFGAKEFELMNGGSPFSNLPSWASNAPGFNLGRVKTPMQLVALERPSALLSMWETFSALSQLGRPVELFYLPETTHVVLRPWERFASQQRAVDWFRFWLQGYKRTSPCIEAGETSVRLDKQYTGWTQLRDVSK